jgi:membrane protease YdiL (CAAX protease family)
VSAPTDQQAGFDATANDFTQASQPAPGAGHDSAAPPLAPHPDNPPWGVLAAVGVTLGMLVLMLALQLLVTTPYLFYRVRAGMPVAKAAEELPQDATFILLAVLSIIPAHLLTLLLAWAVVTGFAKRPFLKSLGWSWSPRYGRTEFFFLLGVTLAMLGVGQLMVLAFGDRETSLTRMLASSAATRYAIAALATFSAPVVEEVVYRGVLYSALRRRLGAVASVVAVLLLFAAIHFWQYWESLAALVTITLLSLVLTVVRAWAGRLLPCVVIHLLFNGITSLFIVLAPQAAERAPAPPAPPTGAIFQLFDSLTRLFG